MRCTESNAEHRYSIQISTITGKDITPIIAFTDHPDSRFAENIRTARTGVALLNIEKSSQIILVTSSVPAEGKSTIALNTINPTKAPSYGKYSKYGYYR